MNKNYIFAGIGVVGIVAVIIVLVMMNTHPSLAEIVENRDCQEIGKWDQRMDETYGYDVKKAKAELNISDELFSEARSLGISCALGGSSATDTINDIVSDVLGGSSDKSTTPEEKLTKEETANIEVIEIIQNNDCNEFVTWKDKNTVYFDMIDKKYDYSDVFDDINTDSMTMDETEDIQKYIKKFAMECKVQKLVDEFKISNPSSLDPTEAISELLIVLETWDCKEYNSWFGKYNKDFDYVKDRLVGERNAHEESCMIGEFAEMGKNMFDNLLSGGSSEAKAERIKEKDELRNILREIIVDEDCEALKEWMLENRWMQIPPDLSKLKGDLRSECVNTGDW